MSGAMQISRSDRAAEWMGRLSSMPLSRLLADAWDKARDAHGDVVTYSPKVFLPLTKLCRDVCHYCTFAETPRVGTPAYMSADALLAVARAGAEAGCTEALFTIGEAPEERYAAARDALAVLGHESTNAYCAAMADLVQRETGLLAHINAGVLTPAELGAFRRVSASQGLMLESIADRLCEKGGPHYGSPGKQPARRLAVIEEAGALAIPFTTGILIGIGETRAERIEALLAIADLHAQHGHIQEVIVQNFQPKPGTKMARVAAVSFDDLLWTTAAARLLLPAEINLQVPPNLSSERFGDLLSAGINDWGGISPLTIDHVNPEAAWPAVDKLRVETARAGLELAARLPVYPTWADKADRWLDPAVAPLVLRSADAEGLARQDFWSPGDATAQPPMPSPALLPAGPRIEALLARADGGDRLEPTEIEALLSSRGGAMEAIVEAADRMRATQCGDTISYVVNRNINYTNICSYRCSFCAFSKGRTHDHLRGTPYDLSLEEIARRVTEAWARGGTEVCMQGGIHPRFTGRDYLDILGAAKRAVPDIHVHAFSPLEVHHGATTLGVTEEDYLAMLRDAGLGSLPGTAAEILHDAVRARICPDKLDTEGWLRVIRTAHQVGLRTTATIMFGHVETHHHVAQHLLAIRDLQSLTGGFTEFVPLPFVHAEAPMFLRGTARRGPTFRETILMHAVARLVLGPLIPNIQASWVKLGEQGIAHCLAAGVNDVGGTLMNESISRAAGASHGQEWPPEAIEALAHGIGREARQRTTLYGEPANTQRLRSYGSAPLAPLVQTPPVRSRAAS
jgi:FO synthase